MNEDERVKLQFEYAWRWFDSHAKQRMMMFYYYLIMVSILANAWILSYERAYTPVTLAIGLMGVVASISAICFDVRNRQMSKAAEDILEHLEKNIIYGSQLGSEEANVPGPLSADRTIGMREGQQRSLRKHLLKHKFWIRLLEGLLAVCFAIGTMKAVRS